MEVKKEKELSEPLFYADLFYKFQRIVGKNPQKTITKHYKQEFAWLIVVVCCGFNFSSTKVGNAAD